MTSSNFQEATITSQTVLPLVNEIVSHHQLTFEQFSRLSLQEILVEEMDADSYFSRTKKGLNTVMHAWPHSGIIKVNTDYFNTTNATVASDQHLEQSVFLEYVSLHEMSHLAFCKQDSLQDVYQQLFLLEPHEQFTSLLEAFANALAMAYVQSHYQKNTHVERAAFFLEQFLPKQHDTFIQTPYFSELYALARKKSPRTFYQEAEQLSQEIFSYHFCKAELREQAAQSQPLPKQLVIDF
jgi:hypothetical protein